MDGPVPIDTLEWKGKLIAGPVKAWVDNNIITVHFSEMLGVAQLHDGDGGKLVLKSKKGEPGVEVTASCSATLQTTSAKTDTKGICAIAIWRPCSHDGTTPLLRFT